MSGGMQGRSIDQVRAEREYVSRKLQAKGIFPVDPAAAEQKLWKPGMKSKIPLAFSKPVMKAFVRQDKYLIRKSDALLVITGDDPSDGTWWEMGFARKCELPIIMIAPARCAAGNKKKMGWSNILVGDDIHGDIVPNLDSAINIIKRKYVRQENKHKRFFERAIKNARHPIGFRKKKRTSKRRVRRVIVKR